MKIRSDNLDKLVIFVRGKMLGFIKERLENGLQRIYKL